MLEASPQLQWRTWWGEEARALEQQDRARGHEISQDQILGEGQYADLQRQCTLDDNTLILCCIAALNAWTRLRN